jgi:geranylgeranyl reductase
MSECQTFDVVVVGGGPAGATAANDLARDGYSVALIDRGGRIKPCGGAIPPKLLRDFAIPEHLMVAQATTARMVAPSKKAVDMEIGGFVGMVDREEFDEWLRDRAARNGATRLTGSFKQITRDGDGYATVHFAPKGALNDARQSVRARLVIGADGARSAVAKQEITDGENNKCVFAYHEIVRSPEDGENFDGSRCDVYYQGEVSPDFYGWIFPHGKCTSVGVGSAQKGFSLRGATAALRKKSGLDGAQTIRCEGAPIPLKPLKRWDNGQDVLLVGDAAGVVAPASGEGIFYAMTCGRRAAETAGEFVRTGDASVLRQARKRFMKEHGTVFWILGIMQYFWYRDDKRRERFVNICDDHDVQRLTWQAYMNKKLVRANPLAHIRIFFKDMAHLLRIVNP